MSESQQVVVLTVTIPITVSPRSKSTMEGLIRTYEMLISDALRGTHATLERKITS